MSDSSPQPPRVWLSPVDTSYRQQLATELRFRGMIVERTISKSSTKFTAQLQNNQLHILYITPERMKRDALLAEELGWFRTNTPQSVWLLLEGLTTAELHDSTLGDYVPWRLFDDIFDDVQRVQLDNIAYTVLKNAIVPQQSPSFDEWFEIKIHSYDNPPQTDAHLIIDVSDIYNRTTESLDHIQWQRIETALHHIKTTLGTCGAKHLSIFPTGTHMTASLLFGATFSHRVSFIEQLRVANKKPGQIDWWDNYKAGMTPGVKAHPEPEFIENPRHISLEWAFAQNPASVFGNIDTFLQSTSAPSIDQRVKFLPTDTENAFVHSERQAFALTKLFRSWVEKTESTTIHLFGSIPTALLILFGRELNACSPVQCYEFKEKDDSKKASYIVRA